MPKPSELPASLKPLALRNAIQVRNTNFGSDAEQLITKMREALALGRPERTQELVLLWFNTHLVAAFLLNVSVFLTAVGLSFNLSGNYAGALAAVVAAALISLVGGRTLARDESVRMFGFVIAVGGLAGGGGDPCVFTILPGRPVREPHHPERDPTDGHLFYGLCAGLRTVEEDGHLHVDAQGDRDDDENGQLAVARGFQFPVEHTDGVRNMGNSLPVDEQLGRSPCADGRPAAGGRLLLRPISPGACRRKSRAGAVMMGQRLSSPSQSCSLSQFDRNTKRANSMVAARGRQSRCAGLRAQIARQGRIDLHQSLRVMSPTVLGPLNPQNPTSAR
jgi:hypothetical protein